MSRWFSVAIVLALVPPALADQTQPLLGPGQGAVILRDKAWKPSAWYDWGAHAILERFLALTTGRQVPVLTAPLADDGKTVRIWAGRQAEVDRVIGADLDKLDDDGFILLIRGRDVYLAGKHWWGSNWAAHDFLERFASCRWYGPEPSFWKPQEEGKAGPMDVIPKLDRITVPVQARIVEQPAYKMRFYRFMPQHSFRLRYRDKFHHALVGILPPEKFGPDHPEYFPFIHGKRQVPPPGSFHFQPCATNGEVVRIVAAAARDFFDKNPREGSFSIGMNDTNAFCECEKCLAAAPKSIGPKDQRLAWAFFDFYNRVAAEVARTHPDKRLGCLAYAGLSVLPPGSIRLHPMIVPYLTRDSAQLFDRNEQAEFRQLVDRWKELATRMGIYEYIYGGGFVVPRLYSRYLLANVRDRYGVGVDGLYAESYPNWGLDGPKYWLLSRMLWDNRLDPAALADQYCRDLFGPAAAEMRAYFELLEQTWCGQGIPSDRSNYRWFLSPRQLEVFPPEACDRAWALLDKAGQKADGDATVRGRIEYFQKSFALTRTLSRRYAACAALDELMKQPAPPLPAAAAASQPVLEPWLGQRLDALQAWMGAGDLDAAWKQVPPGAIDTNVVRDIHQFDRQPVDAVAALLAPLVGRALVEQAASGSDDLAGPVLGLLARARGRKEATPASEFIAGLALENSFLRARRAPRPPVIDGQAAQNEWPVNPSFSGRLYRVHTLAQHDCFTFIDAVYDEANLYLRFDCRQNGQTIRAAVTDADRGEWRQPAMAHDDCVNITFRTGPNAGPSVRVNANGALGYHSNAWNPGIRAAATKDRMGWMAELAIPLEKIGAKPVGGVACYLGIARFAHTQPPVPATKDKPADAPHPECFTVLPAPHGKGIIGHGNHPQLMTFITGPRLVFLK